MKKWVEVLPILLILIMFTGCSVDEVIRVGTPFGDNGTEGVKFHNEMKDSESIEALRKVIDKVKEIEKPEDLDKEPKIFFSLDIPKEGIAEIRLYVWYQDDGSSILYNDGSDSYFTLTKKQTKELKSILE